MLIGFNSFIDLIINIFINAFGSTEKDIKIENMLIVVTGNGEYLQIKLRYSEYTLFTMYFSLSNSEDNFYTVIRLYDNEMACRFPVTTARTYIVNKINNALEITLTGLKFTKQEIKEAINNGQQIT